jgi:hypothetical protein
MITQTMSAEEIRNAGLAALRRELGVVGMVRFLQQFEMGHGDYTTERHAWLDKWDLDAIVAKIGEERGQAGSEKVDY